MQPKRRGLIPLILGLLLMFVGAPAVFVGGTAYGLRGALDVAREAPLRQPGDQVTLTQGEPVFVMVDTGPASGNDVATGATTQECTIADSAGTSLSQESGGGDGLVVNFDGRRWESAGSYAVATTGSYAVTCAGPAKVFTGNDAEKLGGRSILAVLGGVFGGLLIGLIGLILTIVGIVKLVRSSRERRAGTPGGGYGGPGGPYGAPVPMTPYGTGPQQQNAYAVPPPPVSAGSTPYGSAPPSPYGTESQPPAYAPPTTGTGRTSPLPTGSPPYGGAPGDPPVTPPPPPPTDTPTYRDPTSS